MRLCLYQCRERPDKEQNGRGLGHLHRRQVQGATFLVFGVISGCQELTSWCPRQPCLSLANHRTFAWRQWQLRVTGVSVVYGFEGPLEVGSHTAAAKPAGRVGEWLREPPISPGSPPASWKGLADVLGLVRNVTVSESGRNSQTNC